MPDNHSFSPPECDFFALPSGNDVQRSPSSSAMICPDEDDVDPMSSSFHRVVDVYGSNNSSAITRPNLDMPVRTTVPTVDVTSVESSSISIPGCNSIQHVSPLPITSIAGQEDLNPKSASILKQPLEQGSGSRKLSAMPSLGLDTSDQTLLAPARVISFDDSSIFRLPDTQDGSTSPSDHQCFYQYWPSFLLPLYITLFPTVRGLRSSSCLQKILSILAIPAVFCLTITLPVVDAETKEAASMINMPSGSTPPSNLISSPPDSRRSSNAHPLPLVDDKLLAPRIWKRWLTGVQCLCAPVFMTFIFFRIIPGCIADGR
jgi:hypothetical protein